MRADAERDDMRMIAQLVVVGHIRGYGVGEPKGHSVADRLALRMTQPEQCGGESLVARGVGDHSLSAAEGAREGHIHAELFGQKSEGAPDSLVRQARDRA